MQGNSIKSRKEENSSPIFNIFLGSVMGSILFFCLMALFAVAALKSGTDKSMYIPAGMVFGFLSGLSGSFIAVRPLKEKGAIYGCIVGLINSLISSLVLFVVNKGVAGSGIFVLMTLITAGGIAGGIIAVNLKFKKRY